MNFSLYIAKRYLLSKSSNNAINFITLIAAISVILGALALFIVLSGFAGLKDFTLQFTSLVDPDLKAEAAVGKSFTISSEELSELQNHPDIASFSQIVEERVFITFEGRNYPSGYIKGVDEHFDSVNSIDSVIPLGGWFSENSNQIVTGWGISNRLNIGVMDYGKIIELYVPKPGKGQVTDIKQAFTTVKAINVGVFDINEEINDKYVFAPIAMARHLLDFNENQVTAIEFKSREGVSEADLRATISTILGDKVILKNSQQLNDALYKMLNTENLAVYLIFTLILIIALFNVVGTIIMMILDKKKTLHTLYHMGATVNEIRRIFFLQGSLMTVFGGLIGLLIGYLIVQAQISFGLVKITPSLPYPMAINLENFLIVFITISVLGILASKIASARITKNLVSY
ncbi:FtsX-like permease family protein [Bizionia argentinensis JUB59]|uniref:FtsX-like permease family protein n=1 Tax=Bizionia argentinensis JUB59 TaxID=1046627 RepID=G2EEF5_9FLAO|nr:FtsX-like permease family protein [Bizionia argentinensis]EGV43092.2 FtsX-like permease family protein [Bizionia argentinensis JUB59]